ncbi:putative solute-binding protein [Isoalcanivorax beigongshangi]|uniref:Solute-binding protein n=1 Tax=Isoalcanivorax beigongshangi TaxID=3238810 RepID=A0ABV4AHP4_9GAMM
MKIIKSLLAALLLGALAPSALADAAAALSAEQRATLQRLAPGVELTPELIELMREISLSGTLSVEERLKAIGRLSGLSDLPAEQRTSFKICIWDLAGRNGPIFTHAEAERARIMQYGVNLEMVPFTNEGVMVDEFKAGHCDAALMSGMRARLFNTFSGTIDAVGAVPSAEHMKTLLTVAAHPSNAGRMVQGEYVVLGVFPAGGAYIFVNDREINALNKAAGKKVAVLDFDPMQARMVSGIGATPVSTDITRAPGMFNNGVVDVLVVPLLAYELLELYKGLEPNGGIIDLPLAQISLQLIGHRSKFPNEIAQLVREAILERYDDIMEFINKEEARIPKRWMVAIPDQERDGYETMMQDARIELRNLGYYHPDMLHLQMRIRCRIEPDRSECANPRE